jgi:hypothetical protein
MVMLLGVIFQAVTSLFVISLWLIGLIRNATLMFSMVFFEFVIKQN